MTDEEAGCARVVEETHAFYAAHHAALGDRGYHVMYGPPVARPPILFVGYQPGGRQTTGDHERPAPAERWPAACLYATEPWRLAVAMRAMFGADLLARCTGLNAVFVRSPDVRTYKAEVALALRREIAAFCLPRVRAVVEALDPGLVVAIGFDALRAFGATEPLLVNPKRRTLATCGAIGGREAIAVMHLSGAQIATADRAAIAELVLVRAGVPRR